MKFKSALVTQASGSIGGMTFAHNRGGLYTRARSIPVNTNTPQQQAVRNIAAICAAWFSDPANIAYAESWNAYATEVPLPDSFGDMREVSGMAHFIRSNVPRMQAGYAMVTLPPEAYALPTMTLPTVTAQVSGQHINIAFTPADGWAILTGCGLLVYAGRAQPQSRSYFKGPYRYAGKIAGNTSTPPTSPAAIDAPFPIVEDMNTHVQLRITMADGRLSSPLRFFGTGTG